MKRALIAGENQVVTDTVLHLYVDHGGTHSTQFGIAAIPLNGPDRPFLPYEGEPPRYAVRGDGPHSYEIDLSMLHHDTDMVALALHPGPGASMLSNLVWARPTVGMFTVDIPSPELMVGCLIFAELYRHKGTWKIRAKCDGVVDGLVETGRRLGVQLTDSTRSAPANPPAPGPRPGPTPGPAGRGPEWGGSAFLVADRHLVTNAHVVTGSSRVFVTGFGGRHEAEAVVIDENNDLAVIRIANYDRHTPLVFRSNPGAVLGENVTSVGYPLAHVLGAGAKLGEGIVSGLLGPNDDARFFQMTAPIQPGSSGGPVFDASGLVIGISTSTFAGQQNVNLAVRSHLAASLCEAAGIPIRYEAERPPVSMSQLARDCTPLVWRLECFG
jgi:Trypsin-like serine proteases, typically periplasmic, contain C-terminal PDZ domain